MKAARPRSEGEVSRGNTGIDSNLGEGRAVTLEPYPTTFHRLNQLNLGNNQISDIIPLKSLTNLTQLYLFNNSISDSRALQPLNNLFLLDLYNNQISDISYLQSLPKLTTLDLRGNPIVNKICPVNPESICRF
ncbi:MULTISPECIES: leucine-rich repeat domain-containing protein [unclassified Microcoleus]|uniref:leucine-rich repeat domain-containing protein n=1 Tax=unclassified Microcoleus TaxID=2642155 RepID=UPI002FD6E935